MDKNEAVVERPSVEALEDTFPASDIPLHVGAGTKVEKLARQG